MAAGMEFISDAHVNKESKLKNTLLEEFSSNAFAWYVYNNRNKKNIYLLIAVFKLSYLMTMNIYAAKQTNYLLAKDDVGKSKPTTRDLPSNEYLRVIN